VDAATAEKIILRCLREEREDCRYEPEPEESLDALEQAAQKGVLNGPEGCDAVLRLTKALREIMRAM